MNSQSRLCKISIIIIFVMIIAGFTQPAFSQRWYDLEIIVGDSIACQGQTNIEIPIYLKNYADTVAGFSLWLHLDRPDIMKFQTILDIIEYEVFYIYTEWDTGDPPIPTDSVVASPYWVCTDGDFPLCIDSALLLGFYQCNEYSGSDCIDSVFIEWQEGIDPVYTELKEAMVGAVDTVGTLVQGWEMVTARSLTGTGQDILITAIADQHGPPPDIVTPGIGYPQYSGTPLIKILGNAFPLDDTVTNRTVTIHVEQNIPDYFGFTNESGASLCVNTEQVEQYTYFMCEQWLVPDEICFYWNRVMESECPPEGCDSIQVDTLIHGFLDVDKCCDPTGENCLTEIEEWQCSSQFGGTGVWHAGCIRIVDGSITTQEDPESIMCGDINNSGDVNILDLVYLIKHLYKDGPPPPFICVDPFIILDVNGDGRVNILDIICHISHFYKHIDCCIDPNWP